MQPNIFLSLGGFLAAVAVALGAIGAHALKTRLTPEHLATFHTAVQYQMYHALGLVLVGLASLQRASRWLDASGWAMLAGIMLFSGFLYLWLATGRRMFVAPVPVGGTVFIVAWILFTIGVWRMTTK
jgi:uncharacterized membrane protein YgdD (TMEM256/DUF423 family)